MGSRGRRRERAGRQPKPDRKPERPKASPELLDCPPLVVGALDVPGHVARPLVRMRDGGIGYCMLPERRDECFRAALATATQIPIDQVPDVRLDARVAAGEDAETINREFWTRIESWLDARGLEAFLHEDVPLPRDRWIGITAPPDEAWLSELAQETGLEPNGNPFAAHCLVMAHAEVLFDPAISIKPPPGLRVTEWDPSSVKVGISIEPKE